jgi:hypothetical protein
MGTVMKPAAVALTTLALGVGALGCDGKISQCNRLIKVINEEQKPLREMQGTDPAALEKLSDTLDSVAKKVTAVELKDDKLVKFRDDYAKMATDLAKTAKDTAAALKSADPAKATEAAKSMQSFTQRESDLVDGINKYCSGT